MPRHPAFATASVAVITGAADGIGRAAAQRYASFGMHVLMADLNAEALATAAADVRALAAAHGGRIETLVTDVSQFEQVLALQERAYALFGRVDVLMNNAGTSQPSGAWSGLAQWQHIINVNLWGIVHGVQAFTAAMIAQQQPALIINTGSKQGITNPPGNPAYNVSKAGVKALTEALQHELRNTAGHQVSAHLLDSTRGISSRASYSVRTRSLENCSKSGCRMKKGSLPRICVTSRAPRICRAARFANT